MTACHCLSLDVLKRSAPVIVSKCISDCAADWSGLPTMDRYY